METNREKGMNTSNNSGLGMGMGMGFGMGHHRFISATDAADMRRRYLKVLSRTAAETIRLIDLQISLASKVGREYIFWNAPDPTTFTVQELIDAVVLHFVKYQYFVAQIGRIVYISWRSAIRGGYNNYDSWYQDGWGRNTIPPVRIV